MCVCIAGAHDPLWAPNSAGRAAATGGAEQGPSKHGAQHRGSSCPHLSVARFAPSSREICPFIRRDLPKGKPGWCAAAAPFGGVVYFLFATVLTATYCSQSAGIELPAWSQWESCSWSLVKLPAQGLPPVGAQWFWRPTELSDGSRFSLPCAVLTVSGQSL